MIFSLLFPSLFSKSVVLLRLLFLALYCTCAEGEKGKENYEITEITDFEEGVKTNAQKSGYFGFDSLASVAK